MVAGSARTAAGWVFYSLVLASSCLCPERVRAQGGVSGQVVEASETSKGDGSTSLGGAQAAAASASTISHDSGAEQEPPMLGPTIVQHVLKPGAPLKIIGYGDTRFTHPANTKDTNPAMRKFLVDRIAEEAPEALFETGDLPFIGSKPEDWAEFRDETEPWRRIALHVYPTIGNHEVADNREKGIRNYLAAFPELKGCRYYSVLLGNAYLISVDEFTPVIEGSRQREWLISQIEHLPPEVDFVFFLDHMPLVNDLQTQVAVGLPAPHETDLRGLLEAEKAKTRAGFVVLSGHIHNYERFQRGDICYIITGGGGAKPYPLFVRGREDLYRDTRFPVFHYVVFLVGDGRLDATMYRVADPKAAEPKMEVGERFTIGRSH